MKLLFLIPTFLLTGATCIIAPGAAVTSAGKSVKVHHVNSAADLYYYNGIEWKQVGADYNNEFTVGNKYSVMESQY